MYIKIRIFELFYWFGFYLLDTVHQNSLYIYTDTFNHVSYTYCTL